MTLVAKMTTVIMDMMAMNPSVSIDEKWIKIASAHVLPPPRRLQTMI